MAKKAIAYNVYVANDYVDNNDEDQSFYTKVGVAFEIAKAGLSIPLNALPTNGKLVLFPPKEKVKIQE